MDLSKPKGKQIGSINLHINSKLRISHVEIIGDGDLVTRRVVQDSMMLISNAMMQKRAGRKKSGLAKAAEAGRTTGDSDRLKLYKKQKQEQQDADNAKLLKKALARKEELERAELLSEAKINPGYVPSEPVDPELAKEKAKVEADKIVQELVQKKEKKGVVSAIKSVTKKKENK